MAISFQGLVTKVQTDSLVEAMLTKEGRGVTALESRLSRNKSKTTVLSSMKNSLSSISISIAALQDSLSAVTPDKTASTAALQDVISKYNSFVKAYKEASTSTRNTDGSINQGVLANDPISKGIMTQIRTAITSAGLIGKNLSTIGIKTLADGTLSLNSATFQTAVETDPATVRALTGFSAAQSTISSVMYSPSDGSIASTLQKIDEQNRNLDIQISAGKAALDHRRKVLKAQFSKMEATIGQMSSTSQLGSLT